MDWLSQTLAEVRTMKLELARLDPRRGMPVLPPVGATDRAIVSAQRKLGRALPPSYRAFLSSHDGWPEFFQGATLLGTRQLVRGTYVDLARLMLSDETIGSSSFPRSLVPFGIDAKAETIFAFDLDRDGEELGVVILVSGIGERFDGFRDFIAFTRDVLGAELLHLRSTSTRVRGPSVREASPAPARKDRALVA
jgi:hypothetical protein